MIAFSHPSICQRRFVLVPLLKVAPEAFCIVDHRPYRECLWKSHNRQNPVGGTVSWMDRFSHLHYVAVDGPIGVGKTTFCKILADRIGGHLVLEEATENPFLKDFYKDRKRYALQTQFYFLLSRYQQQRELAEFDLFKKRIVVDYTFEKDLMFASVNLTEEELALYKQVADLLKKTLPKPDLVVFLTASIEVLIFIESSGGILPTSAILIRKISDTR